MHVRHTVAGVLIAAALSVPVRSAVAQKAPGATADHDAQTLAHYHLSEPDQRKYYAAMKNLTKAAMKDEDIAAMAAKYDRVPALKAAQPSGSE